MPLSLGDTGMTSLVDPFFIDGFRWDKVPGDLGGTTIEEICSELAKRDPDYVYCDLAGKTPAQKNALCLLLFNYWQNTEWRYAVTAARPDHGQGGWDWSVLKEHAASIPSVVGDRRLTHVPVLMHRIGPPIYVPPRRVAPPPSDAAGGTSATACDPAMHCATVSLQGLPPWLSELMLQLQRLAKASGWNNKDTGLSAENDLALKITQQCSEEYFHLKGLLGLVQIVEETRLETAPEAVRDLASWEQWKSDIRALKDRVSQMVTLVKDNLASDVVKGLDLVAPTISSARATHTAEVRHILESEVFLANIRRLVEEVKKGRTSIQGIESFAETACIVLEHAYIALLFSPDPEVAIKHLEAMIERAGSIPVDSEALGQFDDKSLDLAACADPGDQNPLTALTGLLGVHDLPHLIEMVGSLQQANLFMKFPNAVHDAAFAGKMASRFLRVTILLFDCARKTQLINLGRWRSPFKTPTPDELVAAVNAGSVPKLSALENKWRGVSMGRFFKTGISIVALYFACAAASRDDGHDGTKSNQVWLGVGLAAVNTVGSIVKIIATLNKVSPAAGAVTGAVFGSTAAILSLILSFEDFSASQERGDVFGETVAIITGAVSAAQFAAFVAYEGYGSLFGPMGMVAAGVIGVSLMGVQMLNDAITPGTVKVFCAYIERMHDRGHPFMQVPAIASHLDYFHSSYSKIGDALFPVALKSPWEARLHPEWDWEAALKKLGFNADCVAQMVQPWSLDTDPGGLSRRWDPM